MTVGLLTTTTTGGTLEVATGSCGAPRALLGSGIATLRRN